MAYLNKFIKMYELYNLFCEYEKNSHRFRESVPMVKRKRVVPKHKIVKKKKSASGRTIAKRRYWAQYTPQDREFNGYYVVTFKRMKENNAEEFFKHTNMTSQQFDVLLGLVKADLTKYSVRRPIPADFRLALTLSYLAMGYNITQLGEMYKVGRSSVREIVLETCDVLWNVLSILYGFNPSTDEYQKIAEGYWNKCQTPNCVGVIDLRHIEIEWPIQVKKNGTPPLYLISMCDADLCFRLVEVGQYHLNKGVPSDAPLLQQIDNSELPIPGEASLPNSEDMRFPHYFIANSEFVLKPKIMLPYKATDMDYTKKTFNYRISKAQRAMDNAIGVLNARWKVLQRNFTCHPENAVPCIKAALALHNFIKLESKDDPENFYCPKEYTDFEDEQGNIHVGQWRFETEKFLPQAKISSDDMDRYAFDLRDTLAIYYANQETDENVVDYNEEWDSTINVLPSSQIIEVVYNPNNNNFLELKAATASIQDILD